eukprot:scaffold22205_cov76-Cyclotella_meneghiniana.AAC.13
MSAPITSARIKFETLARHISSTASSANSFKPESEQCIIASARNEIFTLGSVVGRMCSAFLTVSHDGSGDGAVGDDVAMILGENECAEEDGIEWTKVSRGIVQVIMYVFLVAIILTLETYYGQGKSGKYTKYSEQTGITKTEGQSTVGNNPNEISFESIMSEDPESADESDIYTIEGVTLMLRQFALERLWNRFHTPRNIALALIGEVGELAELFQWSGDTNDEPTAGNSQFKGLMSIGWSAEQVDKVGQEIADVSIYLLRLADVSGVSLGEVSLSSLM